MARVAVTGTQSVNGAHTAGHTSAGSETAHVYISFDNATVTSFSTFRGIVMAMLKVFEGSSDFASK